MKDMELHYFLGIKVIQIVQVRQFPVHLERLQRIVIHHNIRRQISHWRTAHNKFNHISDPEWHHDLPKAQHPQLTIQVRDDRVQVYGDPPQLEPKARC